ncbi:MAG: hypothetical protein WCA78_12855 [Rhizomicrobium sp.]
MKSFAKRFLTTSAVLVIVAPTAAWACACGCGVFDVGAGVLDAMPASETGLSVWFRYSYMDQNHNWERGASAAAADNNDKAINTSFYTVGSEYMVNSDWTVMAELPIYARQLTTTDDGTVVGSPGSIYTGHLTDLGDLQISAAYTGLSSDMSSGLTFGMKLPTGNYTGPTGPLGGSEFDRDSLPGTGSTDIMVGGYHTGSLNFDGSVRYFLQAKYQFAVLTRDDYRPGNELDGAVGLSYDLGQVGPLDNVTPILQLIGSFREHDSGGNADTLNSGYTRLLLAPGFEVQLDKFRLYGDVEFPIYQYTNAAANVGIEGTSGQLVASTLFKAQLAYDF